jgi:hypothetical protein
MNLVSCACLLTNGAKPFLRNRQLCSYVRTSQHFMEPEGSLPHSQEPSGFCPGLRLLLIFRNKLIFYGEELLAPRPSPKLEDQPFISCLRLLIQYIRSYLP